MKGKVAKVFREYIEEKQLTPGEARAVLAEALRLYFNTKLGYDCLVHISNDFVVSVLVTNPVTFKKDFSFEEIDEHIKVDVGYMEELLTYCVENYKAVKAYNYWRQFKHKAVQGIIISADERETIVELGSEQIGIMKKAHYTKKEEYVPGEIRYFYVLKVTRLGARVNIELSRNSINFPSALFKLYYPHKKFKCVWRRAGHKCIVVTDFYVPKEVIVKVAKELGEVVRVIDPETYKVTPPYKLRYI